MVAVYGMHFVCRLLHVMCMGWGVHVKKRASFSFLFIYLQFSRIHPCFLSPSFLDPHHKSMEAEIAIKQEPGSDAQIAAAEAAEAAKPKGGGNDSDSDSDSGDSDVVEIIVPQKKTDLIPAENQEEGADGISWVGHTTKGMLVLFLLAVRLRCRLGFLIFVLCFPFFFFNHSFYIELHITHSLIQSHNHNQRP